MRQAFIIGIGLVLGFAGTATGGVTNLVADHRQGQTS
jgi:hypothetical protein